MVLGLVLAGCSQGDVQHLDAESALRDAVEQLEELANSGPVRDASNGLVTRPKTPVRRPEDS